MSFTPTPIILFDSGLTPSSASWGLGSLLNDVSSRYSLDGSNNLVYSGASVTNGAQLLLANCITLHGEVFIDIPDVTQLFSGQAQGIAGLAADFRLADSNKTYYRLSLQPASASTVNCWLQIYKLGILTSVGAVTVTPVGGRYYRLHAYVYWDEVGGNSISRIELIDISTAGGFANSATPLGSGTVLGGRGSSVGDIPPGYATHMTPGGVPGSLCQASINGGIGIDVASSNAFTIARVVIRDPIGFDISTPTPGATVNRDNTHPFPGKYIASTRTNSLAGSANARIICVTEHIMAEDGSAVILGFDNTIHTPDTPNNNAVSVMASVGYPVDPESGFYTSQLGTPYTPCRTQGSNRVAVIQPGGSMTMQPVAIPGGFKRLDKLLVASMWWAPNNAVLPYGEPKGDSCRTLVAGITGVSSGTSSTTLTDSTAAFPTGASSAYGGQNNGTWWVNSTVGSAVTSGSIASNTGTVLTVSSWSNGTPDVGALYTIDPLVITPSAPTVRGYYSAGNGSIPAGTYYFTVSYNNPGVGESLGSAQTAINTSVASSGAGVSYGVNSAGYGVITDSGQAFVVNVYAGAQITVTGNAGTYTVVSNTATTMTVVQSNGTIGWLSSQPANTTAYALLVNLISVSPTPPVQTDHYPGAANFKVYGGTTNGSGWVLQSDKDGVPIGQFFNITQPLGTVGAAPPTSNTCVIDYTLLINPAPNNLIIPPLVTAGLSNHVAYPAFIGGVTAKPAACVLGVIGTSKDQGTNDFWGISGGVQNGVSTNAGGWCERAFKQVGDIVVVNMAKSGAHFAELLNDIHGKQLSARLGKLASCTDVVVSTLVNDSETLVQYQAKILAFVRWCTMMNVRVWLMPSDTRTSSTTLFTDLVNQSYSSPASRWDTSSGSRALNYNAWIATLEAAGTIAGVMDAQSSVIDAGTHKWGVISNGQTIIDPHTITPVVWTDVTGTATGSSSTTLTDSGAAWTASQFIQYGDYVVKAGASYGLITANTNTQLTLSSWVGGTPASNATYRIAPIITHDGIHDSPHGAAARAYQARTYIPRLTGALAINTVNDLPARGPVTTGRARN